MVALMNAGRGARGRVLLIKAGLKRRRTLRKMGIFEGAMLEVISDASPGGIWIRTKLAQISLSKKSAGDIFIG
ncbi:MAG: FeoA domain-containing protein [Christensenellales bacterium]|jgi:Fe2+ transport system protein FeoA